jgi:hypothetical protein
MMLVILDILLKIADSYFKLKRSGEPWRWYAEQPEGKHE